MDNHFSLLNLPKQFDLSPEALEQAWKQASSRVHPDRFATASAAEKRVAVQWASRVNDAYQTLKNPLSRAAYMCELEDFPIQAESNTAMGTEFLMTQMHWREQLDDVRTDPQHNGLTELLQEIQAKQLELFDEMKNLIDARQDYASAAKRVREWMFVNKMHQEVKAL